MKKEKELYLVMSAFAGSYLDERDKENIGHENINFFKPSNDERYFLWFNSSGLMPKRLENFKGNITLLIVQNLKTRNREFKILALAKKCRLVNAIPNLKKYIENNVKYGNILAKDIFKDNTYQGSSDDNDTIATFFTEPENVYVPQDNVKPIIIRNIDGADIKQNMANQPMRIYIKDVEAFLKMINDDIQWKQFDKIKEELPGYKRKKDEYKVDNQDDLTPESKRKFEIYKFLDKTHF